MDGQRWHWGAVQPGWRGGSTRVGGRLNPGGGAAQPEWGAAPALVGSGSTWVGFGCSTRVGGGSGSTWVGTGSTWVGGQMQGGCNKSRLRHRGRHDSVAMDNTRRVQGGGRMMARLNFALGRPAGRASPEVTVRGPGAPPSSGSVTPLTAAAPDPGASLDAVVVSLRRGRDAWVRGGDGWVGYLRGYAVALPPSELRRIARRPAQVRRWPAAHPRWSERCRGARRTVRRAAVEADRLGSTSMTTRSFGPGARCAAAHAGQRRAFCAWREGQA